MDDRVGQLALLARTYGDVCRFRMGFFDIYLLSHPDYIKELLVTQHRTVRKSLVIRLGRLLLGNGLLSSEGEFHRRQRRLMAPAFHKRSIERCCAVMAEKAEALSRTWQPGHTVDMHHEMTRITLGIIGETMFGSDVGEKATQVSRVLKDVFSLVTRVNDPIRGVFLSILPLPSNIRFLRARHTLDRIVYGLIRERRAQAGDRDDLLSLLLNARDAEGDGSGMTDRQVRDEVLIIFLAGHETTANALTWTWYLLSQHPEIEAKLHEEVDRVLDGRLPGMDDMIRLPYTRMVVQESMRLYPPAYVMDRELMEPLTVGGVTIPKGKTCFVSPWVLHHDPRFFPEPEVFRPERWAAGEKEPPRYAYFPFGAGPRQCIGEQFAWAEAILVLATLAQHWQPRLVPGHPVETHPLITLRPKYGMKMTLEAIVSE
jgi:cytochrome P450